MLFTLRSLTINGGNSQALEIALSLHRVSACTGTKERAWKNFHLPPWV
jgi:hypothetical protein